MITFFLIKMKRLPLLNLFYFEYFFKDLHCFLNILDQLHLTCLVFNLKKTESETNRKKTFILQKKKKDKESKFSDI